MMRIVGLIGNRLESIMDRLTKTFAKLTTLLWYAHVFFNTSGMFFPRAKR
jgi:hypothetical protein